MMTQDLFAVGTLDLSFCSAVAVLGQAENSVVILSLERSLGLVQLDENIIIIPEVYLPVFCIASEHQLIFWFADVIAIIILNLPDIFLCLNALVF